MNIYQVLGIKQGEVNHIAYLHVYLCLDTVVYNLEF
jgi:hypothetical protein